MDLTYLQVSIDNLFLLYITVIYYHVSFIASPRQGLRKYLVLTLAFEFG